jgi:hypothetical protein
MKLLSKIKRLKKSLGKHYDKGNGRQQLNFYCHPEIVTELKNIAKELNITIYPFAEHCLELGLKETRVRMQDQVLKRYILDHIYDHHRLPLRFDRPAFVTAGFPSRHSHWQL